MGKIFDRTKSLGAKLLWNNLGIRIEVQRRRRFKWLGEGNRFDYQKRYVKFDIQSGDQVLDIGSGRNLGFFEYSERQLDGVRSPIWRDHILSEWCNPFQEIFYENQDVFNVMFTWENQFSVFIFRLDGTVQALNADVGACARLARLQRS